MEELRGLISEARGLVAWSAGRGFELHQLGYLEWVSCAEVGLRNLFEDPAVWEGLHSTYYWRIHDSQKRPVRYQELINGELNRQADRLETLTNRLAGYLRRFTTGARVVVVDTNVLLHYQQPEQIPWHAVVKASPVRLVVPLRVIEELDTKKYEAKPDLADRARRLLSNLNTRLAAANGNPAPLRDKVTIEVYGDDEPRQRTGDSDQEVLDVARALTNLGADVVILTGDTGMSIRARALGLAVEAMPDTYLRRPPAPVPAT